MTEITETITPAAPSPDAPKAPLTIQVGPGEIKVAEQKPPEQAAAPAPEVKKKDPAAARAAALKKRETDVAAREQALADKEAELTGKESSILDSEAFGEAMKANPLKALEAAGITFEQLTEAILNQDSSTQTKEILQGIAERIAALEEKRQADEETAEQAKIKADQEYIDRTVADYKTQAKAFVDSKPEEYELIILNEAYDLVFEVVEEYWDEHQKMLDGPTAANAVEKWLEERAAKLVGAKKLQKMLPQTEKKEPVRTLTAQTPGVVSAASSNGKPLSKEESLERAAALLRWN